MAEQRADQEKGAVLIAVNSYWNDPERRLPYSDRVLKGYIETFYRYLFFQVDVIVDFTLKDFEDKLTEFTTLCKENRMSRIAVVLYGHGGIVGGKEFVLTHDLKTLTIVELEEELHIQLPDDNKYLFIDACRKSFSNPPQAYVLQANTDRTTVIRSILLFKTAISNAWSECFAMHLRSQAALSNVVRNVDDDMKQYYTKFVKRVSRISEDEGDQKSEIRLKGASYDPNFRGEARASNQDRIRQLTPYLQEIINVAEETFTTGRAQSDLPPKPNLSFLEGPPDDRSNLTGPGFALSSAQANSTHPDPPPVDTQPSSTTSQPMAGTTATSTTAQSGLPPKPILAYLESPPDDRSNLTGPGFALSSAQGEMNEPGSSGSKRSQPPSDDQQIWTPSKRLYSTREGEMNEPGSSGSKRSQPPSDDQQIWTPSKRLYSTREGLDAVISSVTVDEIMKLKDGMQAQQLFLGTVLGLTSDTTNAILCAPNACSFITTLTIILQTWMTLNPGATWRDLVTALEKSEIFNTVI